MPPLGERYFQSETPPLSEEEQAQLRAIRAKRQESYRAMQDALPRREKGSLLLFFGLADPIVSSVAQYAVPELPQNRMMQARLERYATDEKVTLYTGIVELQKNGHWKAIGKPVARAIASKQDVTYAPFFEPDYFENAWTAEQQLEAATNVLDTVLCIEAAQDTDQKAAITHFRSF